MIGDPVGANDKFSITEKSVLLIDDNVRFLRSISLLLQEKGFVDVRVATDRDTAYAQIIAREPSIILLDIHLEGSGEDGVFFLGRLRAEGFRSRVIIVSGDRSPREFFRAARAGADDFLVKGPSVDFPNEIIRILKGERRVAVEPTRPWAVSNLGYLRSFGLTPREIELLAVYSEDFPMQKILADRVGKGESQVRKTFSRIEKKLGIDNLVQLGHILTVCAMFDRES